MTPSFVQKVKKSASLKPLRSFMLSHHLTRHVRSHQGGQGAYKCNECTSVFDNQDDLIYHSAEHATKSLTCPLCREHFETLEKVTEHIKEHSEGIQYACDYCDLLFTTEQKLDAHCQKEHLSVLAMDRTETANNSTDDSDSSQQFIIEEISINKDGSQMVTTFVDGKEKDKKFVQKERGKIIKSEITVEKARLQVQEKYNEEENEDEEYYFEDDEMLKEESEKQPPKNLIKNEKLELTNKNLATEVPHPKPTVSNQVTTKSSPAADVHKTGTQQKLEVFFKKTQIPAASASAKTVGDVLKNLPKGVVVRRPAETSPAPSLADKKGETLSGPSSRESTPKTPTVVQKPVSVQKKSTPNVQLPQRSSTVPTAKISPQPTKSSLRIAAKRPAEPSNSPPAKKMAVETKSPKANMAIRPKTPTALTAVAPKTPTALTAVAPKTPTAKRDVEPKTPSAKMAVDPKTPKSSGSAINTVKKPILKSFSSTPTSTKKGKTFEMKIGDKMVKVQKVVMTKAEVAAMARDGKIEMQGDTMILKQTKAKK